MPITPTPAFRRLWVFAIDPALASQVETFDVAYTALGVRWDDLQGPGPVGKYVEVIDFDPLSGHFYPPVNLEEKEILANNGLSATESDPRFHQQMVYAVTMNTIQAFEGAIGRRVLWAPRKTAGQGSGSRGKPAKSSIYEFVEKLRVYPHALRQANAYYDPERVALLFGYFPAKAQGGGQSEGLVFTSLSFDVVTHETTHAILDGMHRRFTESTNPDVLAFHEAFADIVALLQHFALPDLLRHQISITRGQLESDNMLAQLAVQFGKAIGQYGALRDAIGEWVKVDDDPTKSHREKYRWVRATPEDRVLKDTMEPHARGAILVSAVFDAFLAIYNVRISDLLRIATGGSGILNPGAIHPDLVNRLAEEAAKVARQVLRMCIRALDYVAPIDITFGEYLRAILTSDSDVAPVDEYHYRVAFIQAFRKWGIFPEGVRTLGEHDLRWQALGGQIDPDAIPKPVRNWLDEFHLVMKETMRTFEQRMDSRELSAWAGRACAQVHGQIMKLKAPEYGDIANLVLGIDLQSSGKVEVHSFRPCFKQQIDGAGAPRIELIIELTQWCWVDANTLGDPKLDSEGKPINAFRFRGGATIVYDLDKGEFRYVIRKRLKSENRRSAQRDFLTGRPQGTYFTDNAQPFRMLHEGGPL